MGMYTELHYNVELVRDVPESVLEILRYMLNESAKQPATPDHPLFEKGRWEHMLLCDSYYFAADTHSTLRFDKIANQWFLCIRCNLKNYGDEIEKFIDWIDPYVDAQPGNFLGFSRYEATEDPDLIRKKETK